MCKIQLFLEYSFEQETLQRGIRVLCCPFCFRSLKSLVSEISWDLCLLLQTEAPRNQLSFVELPKYLYR